MKASIFFFFNFSNSFIYSTNTEWPPGTRRCAKTVLLVFYAKNIFIYILWMSTKQSLWSCIEVLYVGKTDGHGREVTVFREVHCGVFLLTVCHSLLRVVAGTGALVTNWRRGILFLSTNSGFTAVL